jgi:hypothetical protein
MYANTNEKPATAHIHEASGTGASPQASTQPATDEQAHQHYTAALLAYHERAAARHRADEAMHLALAHAYRLDPQLTAAERLLLANGCEERARDAAEQASSLEARAQAIKLRSPGLGVDPMAIVVLTIRRDRIEQTARLLMGSTATASRSWSRSGLASWRSTDDDWSAFEERIGVELVEFMDELPLPNRVASMLPRPSSPASDAARRAAAEVVRG